MQRSRAFNEHESIHMGCKNYEETVFAMPVETTERAMAHCSTSDVLIVGGVGCNERFQAMMQTMCEERGGHLYATDERYCIDNGAMVLRILASWPLQTGTVLPWRKPPLRQRFRTDQVHAVRRDVGRG